jgi:hypothetical protein
VATQIRPTAVTNPATAVRPAAWAPREYNANSVIGMTTTSESIGAATTAEIVTAPALMRKAARGTRRRHASAAAASTRSGAASHRSMSGSAHTSTRPNSPRAVAIATSAVGGRAQPGDRRSIG